MQKQEFSYMSKEGKTEIHAIEWLSEVKPKAILQIAHGVTEYISRYEEFAKFLTEKGIVVVDDMKTCIDITKSKYQNIPYYLLGFSLESFVVRTFLIKYKEKLNGTIIVGTGQTPNIQIALAKFMANQEGKKVGEEYIIILKK